MKEGQIRKALSGFYYIYSEGITYQTRGRGVFRIQGLTPLVGDKVFFESTSKTDGVLLKLLPRKNQLLRPSVANVDLAVVVMSAVEPDFSDQLLDRYLVNVEALNIQSLIYISKSDLLTQEQVKKMDDYRETYQNIGYTFLLGDSDFDLSSKLAELKKEFKNKLVVFMGQSGAGKSTLLNKLSPKLALETGEISSALGRGKHTTRHVELFPLYDGLVADTPGFSSLDFEGIEKENLDSLFPEISNYSNRCRFGGCLHLHEPDCAVKDAVECQHISLFRYNNYLQFLKEIEERKPDYRNKKK